MQRETTLIRRSRFPNFIDRQELKLRFDDGKADLFYNEVNRHLPLYCYAPEREITYVTTIYFDTQDFRFYTRANKFRNDNLKLRLKEYYYKLSDEQFEISPYCWVEIKRRLGKSTNKRRFKIRKKATKELFSGKDIFPRIFEVNQNRKEEEIREIYDDFLYFVQTHKVQPYSATNYRRRTFQRSGDETLRITFDDMISYYQAPSSLYNGKRALTREIFGAPCGRFEGTIVEIKSAATLPGWLKSLLREHPRSNFSKFLTSTQTLLKTPPKCAEGVQDSNETGRSGSQSSSRRE